MYNHEINNNDTTTQEKNNINRETILWFFTTVFFLSIALIKPEIYAIPLDMFLVSTEFLGLKIIEFCQSNSALIVGSLATGVGAYALIKLFNKIQNIKK